jgi:hypothetical protein
MTTFWKLRKQLCGIYSFQKHSYEVSGQMRIHHKETKHFKQHPTLQVKNLLAAHLLHKKIKYQVHYIHPEEN